MNTTERSILEVLVEMDAAVHSMKGTGPKPNLLPLFSRLEELARQLPAETSPGLLHYLRNKSYGKARLWLEGRETENVPGRCGR